MNFVSASSFLSHYYFNKKKMAGLSSFFFGHFFFVSPSYITILVKKLITGVFYCERVGFLSSLFRAKRYKS